ncbi:MAG: glucosamine inositolphosphorylceramide transferase family protein [Acidimicrobiales bacterium]
MTLRESAQIPCLLGQIRRSVTAVVPWSPSLTRNKTMWAAANLVMHALRHAHDHIPYPKSLTLPIQSSDIAPLSPSRRSASGFARRQVTALATHALVRTMIRDEWHVAYRARQRDVEFGQGSGYRLLQAPPGHSYADPLLFEWNNSHWLFLEDFVHANHRARIVGLDLANVTTPGNHIVPVLETSYHLSYPFIFNVGAEVFLIPESGDTKTVGLYRAVSFPDRWENLGPILSNLWCSDATLTRYDGLFWLFVTLARTGMHPSDELHLYFSADLLGPWEPHHMNPIVSDVRAGRAAGRLFLREGKLIRPAQDSSYRYGRAINFQAIRVLSTTDYREDTVATLDSTHLDAIAVHTYSYDDQYEVVDLLKPRVRWRHLYRG